MRVVYVAGPYRAANAWDIEQNVRCAEEAALGVWRAGAAALCPHTMTRYYQGVLPDRTWLEGDLEMLTRCDALLLVDGWEKSLGTQDELALAVGLDIPVFTSLEPLRAWLKES